MIVGVPRETKEGEYRVGLTPDGVRALRAAGHEVLVQAGAGARVGFADAAYAAAGAVVADDADMVWRRAGLVVKVKELQPEEYRLVRAGQILFCYQHLAPDPELLQAMLDGGPSCIAYETVADAQGQLPLLAPMSRIAGRLAPQMGALALHTYNGGAGILLAMPGLPPTRVVVAGAGASGGEAARAAMAMGAEVTVFARSTTRLEGLAQACAGRVRTQVYEPAAFEEAVRQADLVIGAVLVPGRLSPKLISRQLLRAMRPGSALVEIGIDQGGIAETARPTSHSQPFYVAEGIVHYCVPNMPSTVARTATLALTQATLPYVLALADRGLMQALHDDPGLATGLQVRAGRITHAGLAQDTGRACSPLLP